MLRSLIAATVLVVATLTAGSAMGYDRYSGRSHRSYRSYPSYHHHHQQHQHRSHFQYRDPYQWDAHRNYMRHQSRHYRSHSPYHCQPHYGIGVHGRNFSFHFGY